MYLVAFFVAMFTLVFTFMLGVYSHSILTWICVRGRDVLGRGAERMLRVSESRYMEDMERVNGVIRRCDISYDFTSDDSSDSSDYSSDSSSDTDWLPLASSGSSEEDSSDEETTSSSDTHPASFASSRRSSSSSITSYF